MSAKNGLVELRYNVIEAVSRARLPQDKMVVVGGAVMQLFGLKKAGDIDIVVAPEAMVDLLGSELNHHSRLRPEFDAERRTLAIPEAGLVIHADEYGMTRGGLTYMLAPNDDLYQATFEELSGEALDVLGVRVSPLERVLEWKRAVDRPKDREDIELIEKYLDLTAEA